MKRIIAGIALACSLAVLPVGQASATTCVAHYDKYQTALCRYAIHYYSVCYNPPNAPYVIDYGWVYGANC